MKRNKKILKEFLLFTVIPFLIPFIIEIPKTLIDTTIKWIIIILIVSIDFYFAYRTLKEKEINIHKEYIQNSIRYAYSSAHEIIKNKRDNLSHETEKHYIDIKKEIIPYDVHTSISDICKEFKKVIASITQINSEFLSVTFIYRYNYQECSEEDHKWKWIAGKEPTNKYPINEFVKKTDTTYYNIIHGKNYYIFGDNKQELAKQNMYHLSTRDKIYNNIGSIFGILLAFGNNNDNFIEGIITVSTHGKYFTENLDFPDASNVLRNMIIDEVFPYYQKLIETELGLMYIRHINK